MNDISDMMKKDLQENDESFYNKKTIISFFLSFLVCLIHIRSFDGYLYEGQLGDILQFLKAFLTAGITGGAIRLFFVISGVLFYRNYRYGMFAKKLKSRIRTLVVP